MCGVGGVGGVKWSQLLFNCCSTVFEQQLNFKNLKRNLKSREDKISALCRDTIYSVPLFFLNYSRN